MKKSFALAGILMLAAISFSTVYAENGEPSKPGIDVAAQQNGGSDQNSMGQMQGAMSPCMGMGGMMNHQMNGNMNNGQMNNNQPMNNNMTGHTM